MNPITPYEQLIASKLDQVPVPDMADSIWSAIEMQLDMPGGGPDDGSGDGSEDAPGDGPGEGPEDAPGDGSGDEPREGTGDAPDERVGEKNVPGEKSVPKFQRVGWYGLAGVVAMVAAILLWYYSHKGHAPVNVPPPPAGPPTVEPVEPAPAPINEPAPAPIKKKPNPGVPDVIKKDTVLFHAPLEDSVRADSVVRQIPAPVKIDSSFLQKNRVPVPDDDPGYVPLAPRPKKPRGVKGITGDDYKISAGKDSGRRKN